MSRLNERRIARIEESECAITRQIVVDWPDNDVDAALAAKGIVATDHDLIVVLTRFDWECDNKPGRVTVNMQEVP